MKILFIDHGLNLELACLLGRAGYHVLYHVSPVDRHSAHEVKRMGRGFEKEGVHKIDSWVDQLYHEVDKIISPDCHLGLEVDWLKARGFDVWGPGYNATALELNRWYAAKSMQAMHLPMTGQFHVIGVPALIDALQRPEYKGRYVKCSGCREIETFKHVDWMSTQEQFVAPLLQSYGADPELEFMLCAPVDPAVEVGADEIVLKGNANLITPYGYEDKDTSYIGVLDKKLPPPLRTISDALRPHLKGYSTFFSTEARVVPSGEGYPIDLTVRAAHPIMAGLMCGIGNMHSVLLDHEPIISAHVRYVAVLAGSSAWAEEHPVEIKFPESLRFWVKLSKAECRDGRFFTVPSKSFPVQVVGVGPSAREASRMCVYNAKQVEGKDLVFDYASFDKLLDETIPQGRKYGIEF